MTEKLNPCRWCGKRNRTASDWEQCNLSGIWQRLCVRCASRRLGNPWNALLPMRKAACVRAGGRRADGITGPATEENDG